MGIYCKNCGMYYADDVMSCENCGYVLADEPLQRAESVISASKMTPEQAVLSFWQRYSDFTGRSRRSEFWNSALINFIIAIFISTVGILLPLRLAEVISSVFVAMLFLPNIAVAVRRMHDIGKSGWILFVGFIPVIGAIWLVILFSLDSDKYANQYGESPKYYIETE